MVFAFAEGPVMKKFFIGVLACSVLALATALVMWNLHWDRFRPAPASKATHSAVGSPDTHLLAGSNALAAMAKGAIHSNGTARTEECRGSIEVMTILGLGENKNYNARSRAMRKLTRHLQAEDVTALCAFLESPLSGDKFLKPGELNALKNDVLGVLLTQEKPPSGLGRQVVAMSRDVGQDGVWRDYCVQYLFDCYEALKPTGVATNEPDVTRKAIESACQDALGEKDTTIAGTALLTMDRLSKNHAEFSHKMLGDKALTLATDETCSEATRITALRLCGTIGKPEVLPVARMLAQSGDTIMLQAAAIATIGDLGQPRDTELLTSLAGSKEKRIQKVAEAARAKLSARVQN